MADYYTSMAMLFCAACRIFQRNKVKYTSILVLSAHHNLDWRQLSEIPAFFMLLLSISMTSFDEVTNTYCAVAGFQDAADRSLLMSFQ